jgi:hypothetical protein
LSGASGATPIAAGIAGLILELARQQPLCHEPEIEALLESVDGMELILTECYSRRSSDISGDSHMNPILLFHYDEECEDGGAWDDASSPRHETAQDVVKKLKSRLERRISTEMNKAVKDAVLMKAGLRN